jgi:hypothetical protein
MQCWQCGAEVRPGSKRCIYCGAQLSGQGGERGGRLPRTPFAPRQGWRDDPAGSPARDDDWSRSWDGGSAQRDRGGDWDGSQAGGAGGWGDSAGEQPDPSAFNDPLDDPRAPRSLRRQQPRGAQPNDPSGLGGGAAPGAGGMRGSQRSNVPAPPSRGGASRQGLGGSDSRDGYMGPTGARGGNDRGGGRRSRDYGEDYGDGADDWDAGASYEQPARGRASVGRSRDRGAYESQQWEDDWGAESMGGFRIPADAPADGERSRNARRVTTIVLSILLVPLIAVPAILFGPQLASRLGGQQAASPTPQAFATYTPGPTPTVVPHYKLFTGQQSGYLLNYPEQWTVRSNDKTGSDHDHIDTFQSTTASSVLSVERSDDFNAYSDSDILDGEVRAAQQNGATFTAAAGTATSQVIGGEHWLRREYVVSFGGKSLHMVILVCHHRGRGYVIVVSTLDKNYSAEAQKYFAPMLQSFRFGS